MYLNASLKISAFSNTSVLDRVKCLAFVVPLRFKRSACYRFQVKREGMGRRMLIWRAGYWTKDI